VVRHAFAAATLDGGYTVFGASEGMDVVDQIARGDRICRITITEGNEARNALPSSRTAPAARTPRCDESEQHLKNTAIKQPKARRAMTLCLVSALVFGAFSSVSFGVAAASGLPRHKYSSGKQQEQSVALPRTSYDIAPRLISTSAPLREANNCTGSTKTIKRPAFSIFTCTQMCVATTTATTIIHAR
jgi:hypothetical protein